MSVGRYFRFCASVPNSDKRQYGEVGLRAERGREDPARAMPSLTTIDVDLSSSSPPNSSATSTDNSPSSPQRAQERAGDRPVFLLQAIELRQHFAVNERLGRPGDEPLLLGEPFGCQDASGPRRRSTAIHRLSRRLPRTSVVDPMSLHSLKNASRAHAAADAHRHHPVARLAARSSRGRSMSSASRRCTRAGGPARSRRR